MTKSLPAYFIRTAMRTDLNAVRALLVDTWHDTYDPLMGHERVREIIDKWHAIATLEARISQPDSEFIVADNGGELGGVAFAAASDEGKIIVLHQLYVRPDLQGQGIGSLMLGEIWDCFPQARKMRLEVETGNERAIGFYQARNFVEAGKTTDAMGLPVLIYERAIDAG